MDGISAIFNSTFGFSCEGPRANKGEQKKAPAFPLSDRDQKLLSNLPPDIRGRVEKLLTRRYNPCPIYSEERMARLKGMGMPANGVDYEYDRLDRNCWGTLYWVFTNTPNRGGISKKEFLNWLKSAGYRRTQVITPFGVDREHGIIRSIRINISESRFNLGDILIFGDFKDKEEYYTHPALYLGKINDTHYIFEKPSAGCGLGSPYQVAALQDRINAALGERANHPDICIGLCGSEWDRIYVYGHHLFPIFNPTAGSDHQKDAPKKFTDFVEPNPKTEKMADVCSGDGDIIKHRKWTTRNYYYMQTNHPFKGEKEKSGKWEMVTNSHEKAKAVAAALVPCFESGKLSVLKYDLDPGFMEGVYRVMVDAPDHDPSTKGILQQMTDKKLVWIYKWQSLEGKALKMALLEFEVILKRKDYKIGIFEPIPAALKIMDKDFMLSLGMSEFQYQVLLKALFLEKHTDLSDPTVYVAHDYLGFPEFYRQLLAVALRPENQEAFKDSLLSMREFLNISTWKGL